MKSLLLLCAVCVVFSAAAFGQNSLSGNAMNAQAQMFTMAEHTQHASQTGMAAEQDIREHSTVTVGQGERPLWEVMPAPQFVSLGAIAKAYREEHVTARKASVVWNN